MAPPAERPSSDRAGGLTNLQKRILSAAVLLPLVITAIYFGHPYFTVLIAVFAGAAASEWVSVAANVRTPGEMAPLPNPPPGLWRADAFVSMAAVAAIALVAGFGAAGWGVFAIVGLVVLWLVLTGLRKDRQRLP